MQLVEKHIIGRNHNWFKEIDDFSLKCKDLYNTVLYQNRQVYFCKEENLEDWDGLREIKRNKAFGGEILNESEHRKWISKNKLEQYYKLPTQVSKEVVRQQYRDWKSFTRGSFEFLKTPKKFLGKPKPPKYKKSDLDTGKGRCLACFYVSSNSISKKYLKKGIIKLSGLSILITSKKAAKVKMVRIVPKYGRYVIELVYNVPKVPLKIDNGRYASIDLGINSFSTVVFNTGLRPIIIDGKPLKNINNFYNKELARLKSELKNNGFYLEQINEKTGEIQEIRIDKHSSRALERLTLKRNSKIEDYFHKSTTFLANYLASNNINKLTIGKNDNWKQSVNIGKRNNQNFVTLPFNKFIEMLKYKCALRGISVDVVEESYTSKCSFLDGEPIRKHLFYKGYRKGKWFKSKKYGYIHADVNAAYNIGRKRNPKFLAKDGAEALPLVPYKYRPAYKSI
ncbi:MAG: RNA-guided endonuclease InsQ/TnpB family protein [Chitinophagales bacterium]